MNTVFSRNSAILIVSIQSQMNILKSVLGKSRTEHSTTAESLLSKKELSKLEQIRLASAMVAIIKTHAQSSTSEM